MTAEAGPGVRFPAAAHTSRLDDARVVVPILLGLALLLRLPNLAESLWFDEVQYSTRHVAANAGRLWHFVTGGLPAPLYPTMAFLWTGMVGESEVNVRVPSLIAGLTSIVLAYVIARRIGGAGAAALAGITLCLSPAHVWYSQEATPYAVAVCFMLAAIVAWPRVVEDEGGLRWPIAYGASFLAAGLTHYYLAAFLLPLTALALTVRGRGRRRLLVANALVAAGIALVVGFKYLRGGVPPALDYLRPFTLYEAWMLLFNWSLHGNAIWPVSPYRVEPGYLGEVPGLVVLQLAAALILLRGLTAPRRDGGPRWELAAYLLVLPATMWVLTLAGRDRLYIERYLFVVPTLVAIALARGATAWRGARVRVALGAAVVVLGVASFAAYTARPGQWTVYKHNPDWQSMTRHLRAEIADPARVRLFAATGLDDIDYYVRRDLPGVRSVATFSHDQLRRWLDGEALATLYLVHNVYWRGQFSRALAELRAAPRLRQTGVQRFRGIELYTFAVLDPPGSPPPPAAPPGAPTPARP